MLPNKTNSAISEKECLLGEFSALAERVGSAEALADSTLSFACVPCGRIESIEGLDSFLRNYKDQVLMAVELPAIYRAYGHATRYEPNELIALDLQLGLEPRIQEFAMASQQVGRRQLKRLRPLRDQRIVKRYLNAVESGRAHAWHTVVYGLVLGLYSVPLRQGLLNYTHRTLHSFVFSAGAARNFSELSCRKLLNELSSRMRDTIEAVLSAEPKLLRSA